MEALLRQRVSDRTAWQRMLRGPLPSQDLPAWRDRLLEEFAPELAALRERFGADSMRVPEETTVARFDYPLPEAPTRLVALDATARPETSGQLLGMKGQYLMLDTGVINPRRHGGHEFELSVTPPTRRQLGLF